FEKADTAPEFEATDRELVPREIKPRKPVRLKQSLIGQVVNRENRGGAAKDGIRGVQLLQVHRRECGLPVVRVHDVGRLPRSRGPFKGGASEHGETPRVV